MNRIIRLMAALGALLLILALLGVALVTPTRASSDLSSWRTPTPTRTPTPQRTATPQPTGIATATPQPTGIATATPQPTPTQVPLTITTASLPNGNVGTNYGVGVTSTGGQGTPHRWSLVAGRLPEGLAMMSSYGVYSTMIHGTPKRAETTSFTVQVKDAAGNVATRSYTLTIDPPLPLEITNQSSTLAPGTVGSSYATSLFANGGVQPYTWAIIAGQLPPGLTLSGNVISGTPTARGTFVFTARVSDSTGAQTSREFSITVS